jgi:hypothetical protein
MTKREKIINLRTALGNLPSNVTGVEAKITKQMLRLGKLEQ